MDSLGSPTLAQIWADAMPLARFLDERAKQINLAFARDKVRAATINDLIAGRIVGLGRPSDSYVFERVDDAFWIGAVVDWIGGTASRDGRTVIEIRVVPAGVLKPVQPEARDTAGRPSKANVIRAAIAAYAKEDPALDRPPSERFQAYCSHIASHGYNPRKDPGFSTKTLEKYEREFRLRNK